MLLKTFPTTLIALSCFVTSGIASSSESRTNQQTNPRLTVTLAACKELPDRVLRKAESEANRIFRQIGITVDWRQIEFESAMADRPDLSTGLDLRIINQPGSIPLEKTGLAATQWEEGSPATAAVILDRVKELADARGIPLEVVLGCLIAHELGHVVLRSTIHSPFGIMRNGWNPDDIQKARAGRLGITDDLAIPIRDAVRRRMYR